MNLNLQRTYQPTCTTGSCSAGMQQFYTIEQPWADNAKGASCVPEGTYQLVPYDSPTHGPTWYLSNAELGVGDAGEDRSFCELHAANFSRQLEGCIAFGLSGTPMLDPQTGLVSPAVEDSRAAIADLIEILGSMSTGHALTIQKGDSNA